MLSVDEDLPQAAQIRLWKVFKRSVWRPVKELCFSTDLLTCDTFFPGTSEGVGHPHVHSCTELSASKYLPSTGLCRGIQGTFTITIPLVLVIPPHPLQDLLKLAEQPKFWFDVLSKVGMQLPMLSLVVSPQNHLGALNYV